jgi:hypothetical protein
MNLIEASSFAGTYLFFNKKDAEGVAAMLGLTGTFEIETDEGKFFMPGHDYDELMTRLYSTWTVPNQATIPQTHPQEKLGFLGFLHNKQETQ